MGFLTRQNVFGRASGDDLAAPVAPVRSQVDQIIGILDDVDVVFDDDDGVSLFDKLVQGIQKLLDIGEMQSRGRFIQDIERASRGSSGELFRQFDSLGLPPERVVADCPR